MTTAPTKELPKAALHPLPPSSDFSFAAAFGSVPLTDIPAEFYDAELMGIKDQKQLDFCAGFAASEVSEDQEAVELDPYFPFAMAKQILAISTNNPDVWKVWGINLRDICEAAVRVGFIEASQNPFIHDDRLNDRDFLANPANWPEELKLLAEDHKKGSYWDATTGPYDLFDNLRSAMWINRFEHRSVLTGANFRGEWAIAPGGVIPKEYQTAGEGHAFKIFGWKQIGDEPYLAVQNSWGEDYGDEGKYWMPRAVANKELTFGAFTFKDMTKEQAQVVINTGIKPDDTRGQKLWKIFMTWLRAVLHLT